MASVADGAKSNRQKTRVNILKIIEQKKDHQWMPCMSLWAVGSCTSAKASGSISFTAACDACGGQQKAQRTSCRKMNWWQRLMLIKKTMKASREQEEMRTEKKAATHHKYTTCWISQNCWVWKLHLKTFHLENASGKSYIKELKSLHFSVKIDITHLHSSKSIQIRFCNLAQSPKLL